MRKEISSTADQQDLALAIVKQVLDGKPLTEKQELQLYRDAGRVTGIRWTPKTSTKNLWQDLVVGLKHWSISPGTVAVITDLEFEHHPSKQVIQELAMSCSTKDEVRAALIAHGLKPKRPPPGT